jgi:hypothetical protein
MYATCLFCGSHLGRNEVLEVFPVGRRLAFDAANGRLWVVCRACERWNLSPLEERWEAIEACEALYSSTRLRVSTENMGLARLKEGLELVRIGRPQRPELAAWRYGDQFGRRRRRNLIRAGAGLGATGILIAGGLSAGMSMIVFTGGITKLARRLVFGSGATVVARVRTDAEVEVRVRREHLGQVRVRERDGEWQLLLPDRHRPLVLTGERAYRAAGMLLPAINRFGGSAQQVRTAVELLERHESAREFLTGVSRTAGVRDPQPIASMSYPLRLAIEMAVHEDSERQALQGELALLERAWREAEEIAAISDSLLVPARISRLLDRFRT